MITRKQLLALIAFVIFGAILIYIGRDDPSQRPKFDEQPPTPMQQPSAQSEVSQITLPHDDPEFPPGPGRDLFLARCTVCHSLRYITMQPNFSKKVWAKEVAKMINTYKAHITGEEAREITNYLATVKGLPESPTQNSPDSRSPNTGSPNTGSPNSGSPKEGTPNPAALNQELPKDLSPSQGSPKIR